MMNKNLLQHIRPLLLIFVFTTAFFISGKSWLAKKDVNQTVLLVGNLLLFSASLGSAFISMRGAASTNPQASVRSLYGSFMIKFFLIAIAAFAYIMAVKKEVNKPALIICAALYIIYTFVELRAVTKMLKQKKNA